MHAERKINMNENSNLFATQTFIPGQVWFFTIDTSLIDGGYVKHRPYLIVAANNRRVTVLKMTKHGERASNWIYEYIPRDESERIILDTPITVDVKCITKKDYAFTFSSAMFKDIHSKFIAAMTYQSFAMDDEYVEMVNDAIENHEETLMSFSPYKMRFNSDYDELSSVECDEDDMPTDGTPDDTDETPADDIPDSTDETPAGDTPSTATIESDSNAENSDTKKIYVTRKRRKFPTARDLIIPGLYDLKPDKIYATAARFNISSTAVKLELGKCLQSGELMYINGNYKASLKADLTANLHKSEVIEDSYIFGAASTAKIWNISVATIYRYRSESKD